MDSDPLEVEIYKFRHHVEAAIVAVGAAANKVDSKYREALIRTLHQELEEMIAEVRRGGPPVREPTKHLLERLGIRTRRGTITT